MFRDRPPAPLALSRAATRPAGLPALVALALVLAAPANARGQAVTGQVIDAVTGDPVAQAEIQAVDGSGQEGPAVTTDSVGGFVIPLATGEYTFRVEHIAYQTLLTPAVELGRGELVTIEIRLGPLPIEMEPLVVRERARDRGWHHTFHRRMEQQGRMGQGRFITREDIERDPVANVNDLLVRQPGLQLVRVRMSDVIVMSGRGQRCLPALYFDGVPVAQGISEIDLSSWFQPHMIEGIEIYHTAASAPPDLRAEGCGVIAIWSRADPGDGAPFSLRRVLIAGGFAVAFLLLRLF
jgi:hypothetical protein